jgi:lipopolysaccharide export system permease protein
MRNMSELNHDIDSINEEVLQQKLNLYTFKNSYFSHFTKRDSVSMPEELFQFKLRKDSLARLKFAKDFKETPKPLDAESQASPPTESPFPKPSPNRILDQIKRPRKSGLASRSTEPTDNKTLSPNDKRDSTVIAKIDSIRAVSPRLEVAQAATNMARQVKSQIESNNASRETYQADLRIFQIQWHKILASSMACIAMFLIGAPLGAIIKRGGLGVPFLVSILFFIVYYLLSMQGEKFAKQGTISPIVGVWAADFILLIIGMLFLRQARVDARLFEADFYRVMIDKLKRWWISRRKASVRPAV